MVFLADDSMVICRLLTFFSVLSITSYCSLILCSKPAAPTDRNPSVTYPSALVEPKPSSGTAENKIPDGSKTVLPADKKSNE